MRPQPTWARRPCAASRRHEPMLLPWILLLSVSTSPVALNDPYDEASVSPALDPDASARTQRKHTTNESCELGCWERENRHVSGPHSTCLRRLPNRHPPSAQPSQAAGARKAARQEPTTKVPSACSSSPWEGPVTKCVLVTSGAKTLSGAGCELGAEPIDRAPFRHPSRWRKLNHGLGWCA